MKRILLLDDNLDIVQIVEEVLAYEQYEVKSVMKSIGFLPVAEHFQPDLIMLDYRLADGNGGEICRAIKANASMRHIPVIIFTAYMQPGINLFDFGCDAVIAKPFDLDFLLQTINKVTNSLSVRDQKIA